MSNDLRKGLIFGVFGIILIGFQPIIANSAKSIDSHLFASMTCLIEAAWFLPLMLLELRMKKRKESVNPDLQMNYSFFNSLKKNFWLLIFIGIIFSVNQLLFFTGYKLAGAINGSLTQKTSVFFGLLFGFFLLKEKISKIQIAFSFLLFFGLLLAITQGSFNFLNFDINILIGVLIVLLITALWMFGHTITKSLFNRNDLTPTQMVFIRNMLSGVILIITFLIFSPVDLSAFFNPYNQFFFIVMGTVYGLGLYCWYKTLSYLDVSNATIILSPTPIVTAIFATLLLGELFTLFHLIGSAIVIFSIIIIIKKKIK
ncbi:MAG: DMT family transporter [Candidatus Lokiarchaeota archaeon]|nr:DMT family transporter [Candidatus Lokiarchaeota archaeon]